MVRSTWQSTRRHAMVMMSLLVLANIAAWGWAFYVFHGHVALMGTALLAWTYGLRHAVDADHIAAIDNVTRKLMQQEKKPIAVGAFFSLGHSTIVIFASLAIALATSHLMEKGEWFQHVGGLIGTSVSALFLLALALVNLYILRDVYRRFHGIKQGHLHATKSDDLMVSGGLMSRLYRRLFGLIEQSWQMYFVGFLFGLGFDTATEVGLLGISAAGSSSGLSAWSIMVFPALFTAAMAFVDSLDNLLMVKAYGWAFEKPLRKLYYNMTITATSVVVALFIGGLEALGLIGDQLNLSGAFWNGIEAINDNLGDAGFAVIAIMLVCWLVSLVNYRLRGYDKVDLAAKS
ncbi:High-affinity nickel transport protein [Marinomonas spartinae]|uniref:Nickel/cobalt efflux system n=1 Tax=Marinomonas spartinae TaxID=1792290 RepID=A0A1A8T269_9GAMM|nr:HoxN/HupN/NixA family nickel/cobalt transporter [Marinomonas spartinae]SBS25786.1 High-affinity nickel transport protein [Marinomonas spartinae]